MSILNNQSKVRFWPLKGDQGETPAWAASSQIDFDLSNIPKVTRGNGGNLANYVPAIALTAWGTYTADGDNVDTERVTWEDLAQALYANFDLQGAWHGRPLAYQHVRGATARIWELISLGYQSGSRHVRGGRASTVAVPFRHTIYLPLSHALGINGARYTSQLSILYKDATLYINTPATPVTIMHNTSEGAFDLSIVTGTKIRASAVLLPEKAIRIAPGVEWLEFQSKGAAASSDPVNLDSLGNATALEGVEPGAGIDTMLALCGRDGLLGSFTLGTLTQFSAPFLDQTQTRHLDPFINMLEQVSAKGQRPRDQQVVDIGATAPANIGTVVDSSGFPNLAQQVSNVNGVGGETLNTNGLCFPIIVAGPEFELTKIQRFEGTQTYYRECGSLVGSIDRTLVHQYKSWTPSKHEDFRQLVIAEGLAADVLGTKDIVPMGVRNEVGKPMDPARGRFFPVEWVKPSEPEKKSA